MLSRATTSRPFSSAARCSSRLLRTRRRRCRRAATRSRASSSAAPAASRSLRRRAPAVAVAGGGRRRWRDAGVLDARRRRRARRPPNSPAILRHDAARRMQIAERRRLGAASRSTRCRPSSGVRAGRWLLTTSTSSQPSVASLPESRQTLRGGDAGRRRRATRACRRCVAAFMNFAHDRHRDVGGEAVRQNRVRLIEADPDAGHELRREADEPRVVEIVGRAGLAGGRQREAQAARARLPVPALIDVGHHRRHQERRRVADRARRRLLRIGTARGRRDPRRGGSASAAARGRGWRTPRTPRSSTAASPRPSRARATARSARRRRPSSSRTARCAGCRPPAAAGPPRDCSTSAARCAGSSIGAAECSSSGVHAPCGVAIGSSR